ncbi:MAG: TA system VapC family ribonuclease toxin [Gammaproteobacteria bacterium]|nr:TA system VapC family ribonuclease toxin [Gammaproteobacteria bacterium]
MIAVDTNVLIYAHRQDDEWRSPALTTVRQLAEGTATWSIPWPCLHEFVAISTHPRIFDPPSTRDQAIEQVNAWLASPSVVLLAEGIDHWQQLVEMLNQGQVRGPKVHDARIAAICIEHGVSEFPDIRP